MSGWLEDIVESSRALAVGVFSIGGAPIYLNRAMRRLTADTDAPADALLNPPFEALRGHLDGGGRFEGVLTFGAPRTSGHSALGRASRVGDEILIVAEPDVDELSRQNDEMAALNREISTLQRELIREKRALQRTLRALRETQAMLVQSEKMSALGQLVAGVAHEVNNPVAFVLSNLHSLDGMVGDLLAGYAEVEAMALEGAGASRRAAVAAVREARDVDFIGEDLPALQRSIRDGLLRVKQIVEDLRRFSRLDEAERKDADLDATLRSTLTIAGPELRKRRVSVRLETAGLPRLVCYPAELSQVFLNLIINAAQAIGGDGALTIRGAADGDALRLTFEDTGGGIPADVIGRVFDPFFTTKPVGAGSGLGLSLAYKIITDRHGGSIRAESPVGGGAVFTITLPRAGPPEVR